MKNQTNMLAFLLTALFVSLTACREARRGIVVAEQRDTTVPPPRTPQQDTIDQLNKQYGFMPPLTRIPKGEIVHTYDEKSNLTRILFDDKGTASIGSFVGEFAPHRRINRSVTLDNEGKFSFKEGVSINEKRKVFEDIGFNSISDESLKNIEQFIFSGSASNTVQDGKIKIVLDWYSLSIKDKHKAKATVSRTLFYATDMNGKVSSYEVDNQVENATISPDGKILVYDQYFMEYGYDSAELPSKSERIFVFQNLKTDEKTNIPLSILPRNFELESITHLRATNDFAEFFYRPFLSQKGQFYTQHIVAKPYERVLYYKEYEKEVNQNELINYYDYKQIKF